MQVSKLTSLCRLGLHDMILYKLHMKWKHLVSLIQMTSAIHDTLIAQIGHNNAVHWPLRL